MNNIYQDDYSRSYNRNRYNREKKRRQRKKRLRNRIIIVSLGLAAVALAAVLVVLAGTAVFDFSPQAESIVMDSNLTIGKGETVDGIVKLTPDDTKSTYTISSSDENIVSVSEENKITGIKEGVCTITITTDNKLISSCEVTVVSVPDKVDVASECKTAVGESAKLKTSSGDDINDIMFTFESSDSSVASVSDDGYVKGIKKGTASITVTAYNGVSAKCTVKVCAQPTSFTLNSGSVSAMPDETIQLECVFNDGEYDSEPKFKSSDKTIAEVDGNGLVTCKKLGNAVITCTLSNGLDAECKVAVVDSPVGIRTNLDSSKPMVALTFDDGPKGDNTRSILATLKKYDARATFFSVGTMAENEPDVLKEVYDAGMEIGSHSYDHSYASNLSESQQLEEINKANEAIYNATGAYPTLFRCPGGITCSVYENSTYMPLIMWSIDTLDWKTKNSESTYEAVKSVIDKGYDLDGDIVLMHDIQDSTPQAVKKICAFLDKEGYQMVTVSELAYYRKVDMQDGTSYYHFYPDETAEQAAGGSASD